MGTRIPGVDKPGVFTKFKLIFNEKSIQTQLVVSKGPILSEKYSFI